jgi:hypothetical protein
MGTLPSAQPRAELRASEETYLHTGCCSTEPHQPCGASLTPVPSSCPVKAPPRRQVLLVNRSGRSSGLGAAGSGDLQRQPEGDARDGGCRRLLGTSSTCRPDACDQGTSTVGRLLRTYSVLGRPASPDLTFAGARPVRWALNQLSSPRTRAVQQMAALQVDMSPSGEQPPGPLL